MSPLLAASHKSSGELDTAVVGAGAGWAADAVASGGCAGATCGSGLGVAGAFEAGAGSVGAADRAACAVVPARSLAIGALWRAAAFCRATLAWVGDSARGVPAER